MTWVLFRRCPNLPHMELSIILVRARRTWIILDFVILQLDTLMLIALADVLLAFGFVVAYPYGPTAGFLLDFQPGVNVV